MRHQTIRRSAWPCASGRSEVDFGFSVPGWATGGSVGRVVPTGDFRSKVGRPVGKFSRSTRVLQILGSVGRVLRPKFAQKRQFCPPRCARQGSVGRAAPCRNGPRPSEAVGRWVTLKPTSTSLRLLAFLGVFHAFSFAGTCDDDGGHFGIHVHNDANNAQHILGLVAVLGNESNQSSCPD